ncbi:MAG: hypothetical protein LBG58_03290 [Planctomycetaceae bacterium]|nr:hypothetical protein [Planctomycetaceae bacterium]
MPVIQSLEFIPSVQRLAGKLSRDGAGNRPPSGCVGVLADYKSYFGKPYFGAATGKLPY